MSYRNTSSNNNRTFENKNLNLSQKKLEEFSNLYSQRLRAKVKEIKLQQDKVFLLQYFNDYDSSEVTTIDGDRK